MCDDDKRMSRNALEAIHTSVWGTVALAFVGFLCLWQKGCLEGEYRERTTNSNNRAALYRAQTEGCRTACGALGVREVTGDKCTCD